MEGKSAFLQFGDNGFQRLHGILIPFHIVQENNLSVLRVGQRTAGPLLRRNGWNPVLTSAAADESQIHIVKQLLIQGNERRPEKSRFP